MTEFNLSLPGELAAKLQEETIKNVQRLSKGMDLIYRPKELQLGRTPKELIHKRNKSALYRYGHASGRRHAIPILMVPNLGISRPYIFDLYPGSSFVEHMVQQGFDFYLLDWGVFGDEDNGLTVDECVTRILPVMVRKALKRSGTRDLTLLGYCMGGPLSACYAAQNSEPVKNLVNMAGPIDYKYSGLFTTWLDKRYFDVDKVLDVFGNAPPQWLQSSFLMLKPVSNLIEKYLNFYEKMEDEKFLEEFFAMETWINDNIPVAGDAELIIKLNMKISLL